MSKKRRDICHCGKSKQAGSKQCQSCHRAAYMGNNRTFRGCSPPKRDSCECGRPKMVTSKTCYRCYVGNIPIEEGPIRVVDSMVALDPMIRPRHWPPPCLDCGGFGYKQALRQWEHCATCKDHPGHAMSHQEWNNGALVL